MPTLETVEKQETATSAEDKNNLDENIELTENTQSSNVEQEKKPFRVYSTQEEFDNHSAAIKNSAKKSTERELLSLLGLKPEEKAKIEEIKKAYLQTLTNEEKTVKEIEDLKTSISSFNSQLEEKDYIVTALSKLTGKSTADVSKIVKMAKGLKDEETTIERAIDIVIELIKKDEPQAKQTIKSVPITQQEVKKVQNDNPFAKETMNLTKQGLLIKNDIEKARTLAKEAGVTLSF